MFSREADDPAGEVKVTKLSLRSSVLVCLAGWSQSTGVVARALLMDQQLDKKMLLSHLWELPWLSDLTWKAILPTGRE